MTKRTIDFEKTEKIVFPTTSRDLGKNFDGDREAALLYLRNFRQYR